MTALSQNARTGLLAGAMAAGMLGLGYAAVPLYQLFCQVTGFGGTTQRATDEEADLAQRLAQSAGSRPISIRFDGNTARDLPWRFSPVQATDTVQIGERDLAFYTARNTSGETVTGTASFNVTPETAGKYFNKIQCFCFTEQTLRPGEEVRMPVLFFVDPAILDDPAVRDIEQITLSYTFHKTAPAQTQLAGG